MSRSVFGKFFNFINIFKGKKEFSLGLYGPPNSGKSTLANRILKDILGDGAPEFSTSEISHETREVQKVEKLKWKKSNKKINFNLIDTPGIATKIDFEDFIGQGIKKKDAKKRATQATQGVIDSIKWLDDIDSVLIVLDSTKNPYDQVNITLIGNLIAKKKKILIVANKSDLKKSNIERIKLVFPQNTIVKVSAKTGWGIEDLYNKIKKELC